MEYAVTEEEHTILKNYQDELDLLLRELFNIQNANNIKYIRSALNHLDRLWS